MLSMRGGFAKHGRVRYCKRSVSDHCGTAIRRRTARRYACDVGGRRCHVSAGQSSAHFTSTRYELKCGLTRVFACAVRAGLPDAIVRTCGWRAFSVPQRCEQSIAYTRLKDKEMCIAKTLDGRAVAAAIKEDLKARVATLAACGVQPGLGTILVGDDPASRIYVAGKHRDCAEVGVRSIRIELPSTAKSADVQAAVERLNHDPSATGFIVQLPLPPGIDAQHVLAMIDPQKDADGLHPCNLGRLVLSDSGERAEAFPLPCTAAGILELLDRSGISVTGKLVTVIGCGVTVGRPLALVLTRRSVGATVTMTHSRTRDLAAEVRRADIVVAAAGSPHLVKADWIKPGAVVLDVGITRVSAAAARKPKMIGDVDPLVRTVAGWLSPNPGGVGPMTRVMLVQNVVSMAECKVEHRNEN